MKTVVINGYVWYFSKNDWAKFVTKRYTEKLMPDPEIYGTLVKREAEDITGWKSLDVAAEQRRVDTSGLIYCSVGSVQADGDTK